MVLDAILGSSGALVLLVIGIYALVQGHVVRGSEHRELQERYVALNERYMQMLQERVNAAEALASTTVATQQAMHRATARGAEDRYE